MASTQTSGQHQKVSYIWSQALQDVADDLPSNIGRSSVVHDLVRSLDLVEDLGNRKEPDESTATPHTLLGEHRQRALVVEPDAGLGTHEVLAAYHDEPYVDFLMGASPSDEESSASDTVSLGSPPSKKRRKEHGLEYDCPWFPSLPSYASLVAASTGTACRLLASGETDIAINWDGGRHHAMRNRASGFCYVADVVLGIMRLAREGSGRNGKLPRILYLDLDVHYGDGVAQAFLSPRQFTDENVESKRPPRPPQVLTLSVHHHSRTFFPSHSSHIGLPKSDTPNPFTLSIPLAAYPGPRTYHAIWKNIEGIKEAFSPDYVVLQLGVDGLPGDRVGQYGAWSIEGEGGIAWAVAKVKDWGIPLCVVGGGGYDNANAARAWAVATSVLLERPLQQDTDIPHHSHFRIYAPSFTLEVAPSHALDENTRESLSQINEVYSVITSRIKKILSV